jgi:hypothetical protein
MARHGGIIIALTLLTQLGGIAWGLALLFRRRLIVFCLAYAALWGAAQALAPVTGRVALPCWGTPLRMQSPLYCVLLRNFVTPELAVVAEDAAKAMEADAPGR